MNYDGLWENKKFSDKTNSDSFHWASETKSLKENQRKIYAGIKKTTFS